MVGFGFSKTNSYGLPRLENPVSFRENTDTLIVGTGIAGSVLAFELEKRKANYLICTGQPDSKANTSSISFGHCRVPKKHEIKETVKKSVSLWMKARKGCDLPTRMLALFPAFSKSLA